MKNRFPALPNPVQNLTRYESRNLVSHLTAAGLQDELRGLLALETADGRNAWYDAKQTTGAVSEYPQDLETALHAVQDEAWRSAPDARHVGCLGVEYRFALMLTSVNSLSGTVPPRLLTAMLRKRLLTTTDALSYARHTADATQRAQALVELLPCLDGSQRESARAEVKEAVREIDRSWSHVAFVASDQVVGAKMLAALVPDAGPDERTQIVDSLLERLKRAEGRDEAYRLTDPIVDVATYLTPAQAEDLFEAASQSHEELIREDLLPVVAVKADGALLRRVVAAAREISFTRRRASVFVELAPRLATPERAQLLSEAVEAALEWRSPDQLATMASVCPGPERDRLIQTAVEAAREGGDALERAVTLLRVSRHVGDQVQRTRLVDEALEATKAMPTGPVFVHRLTSLADLSGQLPESSRTGLLQQLLAIAREMRNPVERVQALAELSDYVETGDKAAALAEAFEIFRELYPARQVFALDSLAPRLRSAKLQEAFLILHAIRDEAEQRAALTALLPYRLRAPTDAEVDEVVAAARAMQQGPGRRDLLIALAERVTGSRRASVLDTALDLIQSDTDTSVGLSVIAPSLDYSQAPEVRPIWQRAVRMARELRDATERSAALAALGSHVGAHDQAGAATVPSPREVLTDAVNAAHAIDEHNLEQHNLAGRAAALAVVGEHLPEPDRTPVLEQALDAARLAVDRSLEAVQRWGQIAYGGMPVDAIAVVAARIPPPEGRILARQAIKFARRLPDHVPRRGELRAHTLVTVAPCFPEPQRRQLLHEAMLAVRQDAPLYGPATLALLARRFDEPDCTAALSDALLYARRNRAWEHIGRSLLSMEPRNAYRLLKIPATGLTNLPRKNVLVEISRMAPVIFAIGGQDAVVEIAEAIQDTGRWWR